MSTTGTMTMPGTMAASAKSDNAKANEVDALSPELRDLLENGRFAEYHLERAKLFLAHGNYKLAQYQAKASLCHGNLPAARELLVEIKKRSKA